MRVVSLVGKQGETKSEGQRDAERNEGEILECVLLQKISKRLHDPARRR